MKERLLRLEHENKRLRAADGTSQNADLLQTMIDDLKERETQLQASSGGDNKFDNFFFASTSNLQSARIVGLGRL